MKFKELWKSIVDKTNHSKRVLSLTINKNETIKFNFGYNDESVVLPFSWFEKSGDGTEPDFTKISIVDAGWGVAFGKYEAASDAIYEEVR